MEQEKTERIQSALFAVVLVVLIGGLMVLGRGCQDLDARRVEANARAELACTEAGGVVTASGCAWSAMARPETAQR